MQVAKMLLSRAWKEQRDVAPLLHTDFTKDRDALALVVSGIILQGLKSGEAGKRMVHASGRSVFPHP